MIKQVFKPTVLLVMSHNVTGLKYFCKTSVLDRVKRYKGSGTRWTNHLKVHGKDITVGVLGFYTDEQRCNESALKFSREHNIVESDEWANLIEETGLMTGVSMKGEKNPFYGKKHTPETAERLRLQKIGKSVNKGAYRSPENRAKISASLKGRKNPDIAEKLRGRKLSDETRKKISESSKGRVVSMATKEKIRQAAIKQWARQKSLLADE
jgi:hypothetical protein